MRKKGGEHLGGKTNTKKLGYNPGGVEESDPTSENKIKQKPYSHEVGTPNGGQDRRGVCARPHRGGNESGTVGRANPRKTKHSV